MIGIIGNILCAHNARSPHLRCAINPCGPCNGCTDFEERKVLHGEGGEVRIGMVVSGNIFGPPSARTLESFTREEMAAMRRRVIEAREALVREACEAATVLVPMIHGGWINVSDPWVDQTGQLAITEIVGRIEKTLEESNVLLVGQPDPSQNGVYSLRRSFLPRRLED